MIRLILEPQTKRYVFMKKLKLLLSIFALTFLFTGCSDDDDGTVVDVIVSRDDLSTLATAVTTAGLVDTLDGEGPFTVFAPNNDAFAKLPAGTLEKLLANPEALANILTIHVVSGDLKAADVLAADSLTSLQGKILNIELKEGVAFIDGARIIATDLDADNGTVHIINTVLQP